MKMLRYVATHLNGEHVRASAAIPMLFPTVEVSTPRAARGHYMDGGTRLNSPIKPALNLGADKVIVVGLEPFTPATRRPASPRSPMIADVAANVLDGLLVDQVAADLRRLAAINSFFVEDARSGVRHSSRTYRVVRGHAPYRLVAYALVAPRRHGEIGRLAEQVFERRYGGLRGLRSPDFTVLSRILGAGTRSRGELLSFLLFDPVFVDALIAMGRRDARRWLRRHPGFWCRDATHDLAVAGLTIVGSPSRTRSTSSADCAGASRPPPVRPRRRASPAQRALRSPPIRRWLPERPAQARRGRLSP